MARNTVQQIGNPQLYLTNIDYSLNEPDLNTHIANFGTVTWIRILKSAQNLLTKSALVQFSNIEEAQRCRRELNGRTIGSYAIEARTFMKPSYPKGVSIFVTNFPEDVGARELEDHFSHLGNIMASRVIFDSARKSMGRGFIAFETTSIAEEAIKSMNSTQWNGRVINVMPFLTLLERHDPQKYVNLYVRGFTSEMTEEALAATFGRFGETTSIKRIEFKMPDSTTKPFAYVCFRTHEDAARAVTEMHGKTDEAAAWFVQPFEKKMVRRRRQKAEMQQREEMWKQTNVYIRGLSKEVREPYLYEICNKCGPIKSINIPKIKNISYDADGNQLVSEVPRGIAYVDFEDKDSAQKAINTFKSEIQIEGSKVVAFLWKPRREIVKAIRASKERKNMQMRSHFSQQMAMMNPMMGQMMPGGMPSPMMAHMPMAPNPMMQPPHPPRRGQPHTASAPRPPMPRAHAPPQPRTNSPLPPNFASLSPHEKKQCIGQIIFPKVTNLSNANVAGKVTGMLLEMPDQELVELVTDDGNLRNKVNEAVQVLREAWKDQPDKLKGLPK